MVVPRAVPRSQRHPRPPPPPGKKRRKGMWSCCGPTLYTCGVVCCMWMPKAFLILGIIMTFFGFLFLVLTAAPAVDFRAQTSGACLLAFGIIFVIISSIGLYVKKVLRNSPETEQALQATYGQGRKYRCDDEEQGDERGSQSASSSEAGSEHPLARKHGVMANGHAVVQSQPKSVGSRPSSASKVNSRPASAASNGRPSSAQSKTAAGPSDSTADRILNDLEKNKSNPSSQNSEGNNSKQNGRVVNKSTKAKAAPIRTSSLATSPITEEEEEVDDKAKPPFYTGASGKLSEQPARVEVHAAVDVHIPPKQPLSVPSISVHNGSAFTNDGFDSDEEELEPPVGASVPGVHPYLMETPEELVARSSPRPDRPVSPFRTPRLDAEVIDTYDTDSVSSYGGSGV